MDGFGFFSSLQLPQLNLFSFFGKVESSPLVILQFLLEIVTFENPRTVGMASRNIVCIHVVSALQQSLDFPFLHLKDFQLIRNLPAEFLSTIFVIFSLTICEAVEDTLLEQRCLQSSYVFLCFNSIKAPLKVKDYGTNESWGINSTFFHHLRDTQGIAVNFFSSLHWYTYDQVPLNTL